MKHPSLSVRASRTVLFALLLFLALSILEPLLFEGLCALFPGFFRQNDLLQLYTFSAILLELGVFYGMARLLQKSPGFPESQPVKLGAGRAISCVLLGMGMCFLSAGINAVLMLLYEPLGIPFLGAQLPADGGWRLIASVLIVGVIPAFAEESLFRGSLLQGWLPLGRKKALWRTALLFALLHLQPTSFPTLLVLSLLLGQTALVTGSAKGSIIAHATNNAMGVLLTYSAAQAPAVEAAPMTLDSMLIPIIVYLLVGGFGCYSAIRSLKRRSPVTEDPAAIGIIPPAPTYTETKKYPVSLWLCYGLMVLLNIGMLLFTLYRDQLQAIFTTGVA